MRLTRFALMAIGVIAIVACGEKQLTEPEYIEEAKSYIDKGDYRAAVIQLKNALNVNSNSAQARYLLGDLYVRVGNGADGEKELRRALELGVSSEAITLALADAMLMQGRADELIKSFQPSSGDSSLTHAQKMVAMGEAYFQIRQPEKARETLKNISDPTNLANRAKLALARVELMEKNADKALEIVQSVVDQEKNNVRAWVTLADIYRVRRESEKTIESYRKAVEASPSNQDYFYTVSMTAIVGELLELNKTADAEAELIKLRKSYYKEQFPDALAINHLRSVLAFQKKEYDSAAELAEKVIKVNDKHLGALLILGAVNTTKGRYEQAQDQLTRFLSAAPNHLAARKLLAVVQVGRNQAEQAVKTLKPIAKGAEPDVDVLAMIGAASIRAGDAKSGVEYFEKALEEKPESPQLRAGLAQGFSELGQFGKAIDELEKIKGDTAQSKAADLAIVETYMKSKNFDAALKKLDQMISSDSSDPLPVSLQGTVFMLMGREDQSKTAFERALKVRDGFAPAARSLAHYHIQKKDVKSAEQILENAADKNPKNTVVLHDIARLALLKRDFKKAEQSMRKALDIDKKDVASTVLLAQIYLQQQKPSQALTELRAIGEMGEKVPGVLAEMGNAQMALGEIANAAASFEKLVAVENNALTQYLLFTARMANREAAKAKSALQASLSKNERFLPSLIASFNMAIAENSGVRAKSALQKIEQVAPGNGTIPLLKAEFALFEKNPRQAIAIYEGLPLSQRESGEIIQRLAQSYWMAGDKAKATLILDDAIRKRPKDAQLLYTLGSAYDSMGDKTKAVDAYKKAIVVNDQHVFALNNLAWILKDSDIVSATTYVERAISLAPNNSAVKDTKQKIESMSKR